MWRQSQRREKPFYERGNIRIFSETWESISDQNKRLLDDAVREMPNQRLRFDIRCTSIDDDTLHAFTRVILLNETLQWVQLPQSGFTSDGLQRLFQCLEKATCLKMLTLRDAKLTDATLPSLIGMIERSNTPFVALQSLRLPLCSFSEDKWIQLFQSITNNRTCCNFQLLDAWLTDEVIPDICKFLGGNATLFQLRMHGLTNNGTVSLCQALMANSTARSISLAYGPSLSEETTSSLCDLLVTNTTLKRLNIEDNKKKITSDVFQQLFDALQNNTTMTNVRLGGYMTDEVVLKFAEMLKLNTTCIEIGMKSDCTPEVLTKVWKALAADKKIERLNFQNVILMDSAVPSLCQFIRRNRSVETFDLGQARFSAEGLDKVLCSLLENPNWQNFELRGAKVWDESVDHLCQLIKTNRTLHKLIINWSDLNATQVEKLCKLFCGNSSMKEFWLEMKGLRSDTLEYVSSLLDTGLQSFVIEEVISDAEFNLIFSIVKDNPCIVEARMDPIEHQMIFKYRGIEGAPGLGEEQPQQHQSGLSTEVGEMQGDYSQLSSYPHGHATPLVPDVPTADVATMPDVSPIPHSTGDDLSITTADWSLINVPFATTASTLSTTNPVGSNKALAAEDRVPLARGSSTDDSGSVGDGDDEDEHTLLGVGKQPQYKMVLPHLDDQHVNSLHQPDIENQPTDYIRQQHKPKPSTAGNVAHMAASSATASPKMDECPNSVTIQGYPPVGNLVKSDANNEKLVPDGSNTDMHSATTDDTNQPNSPPEKVAPEANDQSGTSTTADQHAATVEHTPNTTAPSLVPNLNLDSLQQWAAGLEPPASFAEYEEIEGETTSTCKMLGADTYEVKVVRTHVYRRLQATSPSVQEE